MKGDGRWIKISEPEAILLREAGFFDVAERFYVPRARRGQNGGKVFTRAKRKRILERDGYACVFCKGTASLTIDHIIALVDGGSHADANLRTLCQPCHRRHDTELARLRASMVSRGPLVAVDDEDAKRQAWLRGFYNHRVVSTKDEPS